MPLLSSAVGTSVKSSSISVPARWLLAFAAVLDVDGERYTDDARSGGIEALPFLCTRFEWIIQRQLREHPALGLDADEVPRGVHFVQDSRFIAPIRPGMTVQVEGEIREVRAGALIRYSYSLRDLETNAELVQTRSISIYRDVAIAGNARTIPDNFTSDELSQRADLANGASIPIHVSCAFPQLYTECADIWNPIHTERRAALTAGLPDIILHGTATWALAGRELMTIYETEFGKRLSRLAARFSGNVVPPSRLEVRHACVSQQLGVVNFNVLGPNGEMVLRDGLAVFGEPIAVEHGFARQS